MSRVEMPRVPAGVTLDQLAFIVAQISEQVEFVLTGNLSTENAREFAGWRITPKAIHSKTKDVGLSSDEEGADPIRFWAGDVLTGQPSFYVTKSGKVFASNGEFTGKIMAESGQIGGFTITQDKLYGDGLIQGGTVEGALVKGGVVEGATVRSAPANAARIELSGNTFSGFDSSGMKSGLLFEIKSTGLADLHLYHLGNQLLTFYDNADSYSIIQGEGSSVMGIGSAGKAVNANGSWSFASPISGTIDRAGTADYATTAGSTSSLEPGTQIAWSQVLKTASNIADLETKNISDLTQSSSYRTVTDSEKNIWSNKADKSLAAAKPITLLNGWAKAFAGYSTPGYTRDNFGNIWPQGLIKGGATAENTVIFNIADPADRPLETEVRVIASNNSTSIVMFSLEIRPNGDFVITSPAASAWLNLSDIRPYRTT